jgi:YHS domain-containing protein
VHIVVRGRIAIAAPRVALDLGPCSQEEIAVAVLAELVAWRHTRGGEELPPAEAVDPVCGMVVAVQGSETAEHDGVAYFFCSPGCRASFATDPLAFVLS